jgi:hypothetical protein
MIPLTRGMSFRGPWSLGNLSLPDYFPPGSHALSVNSQALFHHEIVIRFQNLPEHSKRFARRRIVLTLHLLVVHRAFTTTCSTHQIKSTRKATVTFLRGQLALQHVGRRPEALSLQGYENASPYGGPRWGTHTGVQPPGRTALPRRVE